MKPSLFFPALVLVALFSLPGCRYNREQKQLIDLAERIIEEHPDSALLLLNTFQKESLTSAQDKARYCVVKSIAYNKCYFNIASDSLIRFAVDYYKDRKDYAYRMKAWYYLGITQLAAKDYRACMYSFSKAEAASNSTENPKFCGLINMGMATAFNNTFSHQEALAHIEKAISLFRVAGDHQNENISIRRKAQELQSLRRGDQAREIYDSLILNAANDTLTLAKGLLSYAQLCMYQPQPDPKKCLELFERAVSDYHAHPKEKDWCTVALAYSALGDNGLADNIISQVESFSPDYKLIANTKASLAQNKGDFKTAYDLLEKSYEIEGEIVRQTLSQSSIVAQRDYFEAQRKEEALVARKRALVIAQISLGSLITLGILMYSFTRRRRRDERRLKAVEQEKTELRAMSLGSNENLKTVLAERDAQKAEINRLHQKETRAALRNLQSQFKSVAEDIDLNRELQNTIDPKLKREKAYQHICEAAAAFSGSDKAYKNLEKTVDYQLDDVMKKFRREVPLPKEEDYRFVCYQIVGFPAHLIAHLCNLSVGSVYTKKSMLTDQIEASDYPHRDTFLVVLGNSKNFTTFV